jgi:hypothetical protein
MMLKIRQDLALPQCPKHPGLVNRFLQGHQVLNLTEGHQPFDPLLWSSILEDGKISGVLGGWVVWIHEELQLDPLRLVRVRPIHLVHLLHLRNKPNQVRGESSGRFRRNLVMVVVWVEILQQKCDHSALC